MKKSYKKNSSNNEKGNVLFYVLVCVAVIAALSYVMAQGSGDSASGMSASRISEEIKSQAQNIRAALMECNLVHNNGYPNPPSTPYLVKDLKCQTGPAPDYVTETDVQNLFSNTANRVLPLPPKPFVTGWQYDIDTSTNPDTITIELTEAVDCAANAGLKSALNILKTQFSPDELFTASPVCNGSSASFKMYIIKGTP